MSPVGDECVVMGVMCHRRQGVLDFDRAACGDHRRGQERGHVASTAREQTS
jgi:hypothetical protein